MTPTASVQLPAFNRRLLLRATVSGSLSTGLTKYNDGGPSQPSIPGAPRTFGPSGYYYPGVPGGCGGQIIVGYGSTGGGSSFSMPCAEDKSTDGLNSGVGYFYSSGLNDPGSAIRSGGDPNLGQCSTYASGTFSGYGPCFSFSGTQTVALDRIVSTFDASVSPAEVDYQGTVTVTATIAPSELGGLDVPWSVDSTRWTYAPEFPYQNQPCGSGNFLPTATSGNASRVCTATVTRSGTLTIFATVNGVVKSKAVNIAVRVPKLTVTANPKVSLDTIPKPVTFTATMTPNVSWSIQTWTWVPDEGSTRGIGPSDCNWYENPCTRTIYKSGVMTVVAKIGEYTLTASVHVWLIPCPVGDPIADNPDLRMGWIAQQDSSGNEGKERGGVVLRNLTTGVDNIINLPDISKAACWVSWPPQFSFVTGFPSHLLATYKIVAFWHTHWVPANYTCTDKDGNPYTAGSGLSEPDWNSSRVMNCPMYTIDRGRIWRIDPTHDTSKYPRRYPEREVRRDPHTKKCPAIPWPGPGAAPGEDGPPYTC